jgi:hypothetical protein
MIETFTAETFLPLVGSTFEARAGAASAALELHEVRMEDPRGMAPGAAHPPFSLIFKGPEGVAIGQGNVELSHPQLPPFVLLLAPVACRDGRYEVQAVFN